MALVSRPAFDRLRPIPEAYATLPIDRAFDWADCGDADSAGEWYLVVFRSIHQPDADEALLEALDDHAHREASTAPGFVHYFKGRTTARGECLSFCLWDSRADARAAAGRPAHVVASAVVREMYASYRLEFYRVRKQAGQRAFEFEPYDRPAAPTERPASPARATEAARGRGVGRFSAARRSARMAARQGPIVTVPISLAPAPPAPTPDATK